MNSKYFAMLAFGAVFLSPLSAEVKSQTSIAAQEQKNSQTVLTEAQKLEAARQEEENFKKHANLIVDNLLPYLENQWVEGYYGFIYKDPIYMTTGIGTKFSIGKTKMNDEEKERSAKGEIIVNNEVMLDQIPFRHKSTGKELTYAEKVAYAKRAKATGCGRSFDGYKRHQKLANEMDVVLTREDARKITRAELVFKIKRIRKLIQNRYGFDIFKKPMAVQMAFTDIAFMAGERNMMQFKNALAQTKAGHYSKLPNYTDCGKGRVRNSMRRNFVRLAALEASYSAKEMAKIKQALDKYNLDLPLAKKIESNYRLLAQTRQAKKQLKNTRETAGGLSELIAAHTISPTMSLAQALFQKENENFVPLRFDSNLSDTANNNTFSVPQGLLPLYGKIADVYLDKFSTLGQSNSRTTGVWSKVPLIKKYTSRQG